MKEGSDIAREVADIIFIHEGLDGLVDLRKLSKALMNRVSHSYWFIVLFNASLIGLGLTGAIMPTTSAWLHNLATISVSMNNMRPLLK
jgi:cation transport ATPase